MYLHIFVSHGWETIQYFSWCLPINSKCHRLSTEKDTVAQSEGLVGEGLLKEAKLHRSWLEGSTLRFKIWPCDLSPFPQGTIQAPASSRSIYILYLLTAPVRDLHSNSIGTAALSLCTAVYSGRVAWFVTASSRQSRDNTVYLQTLHQPITHNETLILPQQLTDIFLLVAEENPVIGWVCARESNQNTLTLVQK